MNLPWKPVPTALLLSIRRCLPCNRALPKPFPTIYFPSTLSSLPYRSFPMELSSCYFPRFRSCPFTLSSLPCRSLPTELSHSHGFPSVHPIVASIWLLPAIAELSPCYFTRFPAFNLVVASVPLLPHGALPKLFPTVSHSVHPVVASISSFLPNGALPNTFLTISSPSTLSSLPYRSFPTELSPFYFPRFPVRPPRRRFRIAPSPRSSPHAISHGFPSVHLVVASISLLPHGALPTLFPTVPLRPPCRRFRIASSQQSSPQAIPHGCPSVHIYGRFRIAPSQRNSPQAISPSLHPAVASVGKERCGSDDKVDGRETVGNSMEREGAIRKRRQGGRKGNLVGNCFGRATEAPTGWMEGKRWEITWGELR